MNSEFPYLFQEICEGDFYRLRELPIVPTIVLDIGANVGVFTTYARFLFPKARIVAVEPDQRNWKLLEQYTEHLPGLMRINAAIGVGQLWHKDVDTLEAPYYGGGQRYTSTKELGMSEEWIKTQDGYNPSTVETISFADLVKNWVKNDDVVLAKIDIEGAENSIFGHARSMISLHRMDAITMELHWGVDGTGPVYQHDMPTIRESLMSLSYTHKCLLLPEINYYQAIRRSSNV